MTTRVFLIYQRQNKYFESYVDVLSYFDELQVCVSMFGLDLVTPFDNMNGTSFRQGMRMRFVHTQRMRE